jgi:hypothetical protein
MAKHEVRKHETRRAAGGPARREREDELREHEQLREQVAQRRKHGGRVHGKHAESRPDRRARGGAEPVSAAGKVSSPPFERRSPREDTSSGAGPDRD